MTSLTGAFRGSARRLAAERLPLKAQGPSGRKKSSERDEHAIRREKVGRDARGGGGLLPGGRRHRRIQARAPRLLRGESARAREDGRGEDDVGDDRSRGGQARARAGEGPREFGGKAGVAA